MPPLEVEAVTDDEAFAGLEADWNALFAETPAVSAFQSFAWISACRAGGLAEGRRPLVLVVSEGAEKIGILPATLGSGGDLAFLGDRVSNYLGPVYRGARLDDFVRALGAFVDAEHERIRLLDFRGLLESSPFLAAWSALRPSGWSDPTMVRTARCPYVDLAGGWKAVLAHRRSNSRAVLARKWKSLARLGRLEAREVHEPDAVRAALPAMFRLFAARWAGRHESGGFAGRFRAFHERAAAALAAAGHVRLSLLELDGHVIAFCYGVSGERGTSSYVIGHDGALATHSPGALLLTRLLEAACARGEAEYDFSLGEESYKDAWATGARNVIRLLHWRQRPSARLRGTLRAFGSRAWDGARSIRSVRDVKREGVRRWLLGPPSLESKPDEPGLPAGTGGTWTVHRVAAAAARDGVTARSWPYDRLLRELSPRLLELWVERSYRNDPALALYVADRLLGVVWRCRPERRALITGGLDPEGTAPVYYHPVPAAGHTLEDLVRALASGVDGEPEFLLVAQAGELPDGLGRRLGRFAADLLFKPRRGLRDALGRSRLGSLDRRDHALDVSGP